MRFLRALLRLLQTASPGTAAWLAERLFFTPPRTSASASVRAFLAGGRRFVLRVEGRRVVGWRWGDDGAPVVYLVHGWGGRGGRLAAFAEPLRAAGYTLVTYDAPGHGASSWGMSSMPEFARTLAAVAAREGQGAATRAVIAHSLGCAGTALALSWGLETERLVFLAPPVDPPAWVVPFARALGLRPDVIDRVRARSERRLRFRWRELHVAAIARRLPQPRPLLIVHDAGDDTVAWRDGAAIAAAWRGARLVTTRGLGHRGIVRDPEVVRRVVEFVTAGAPKSSPRNGHESLRLEYELFYREERWERVRSPI